MNTQGTDGGSVTVGLPEQSLGDLRRVLIAYRREHGADTAVGHCCSNIIELIQAPELPKDLLKRQMANLQRLLA